MAVRRQQQTVLWLLAAAGILLVGLAGCGQTAEMASPVSRTPAATASDAPTIEPSPTLRATRAAPSKALEGDTTGPIEFVISDELYWERTSGNVYSIAGEEDTFAWSKEVVAGDFEFSADVESDFSNYGEAMVVAYGDGAGWSPGCLIFDITGYFQAIRAHSIYDPEVEWLVANEEKLDFDHRDRYRMTIRVAGDEASLFVDDKLVASTPMLAHFNREGRLALVKYGGSAPVTFSNIEFRSLGDGEAVVPTPSQTPAATATTAPTLTPTPRPMPTNTRTPTLIPSPTVTLPPTDTPPPPYRPPTGMLEDFSSGGQGELLIKNGTDADALVILTGMDDQALKSAYIWAADSFNMTGIPDGTYRLYYSKGEAFNQATNRFTQNATYQRLDATIEFTTSGTQYTAWEVTLYGVVGGTVGSEPVDPSDFP